MFNFYRPDHIPQGEMADRLLAGPVFQITDSYSSISLPNRLWQITEEGFFLWERFHFPPDYQDLMPVVHNTEALLDRVNLLMCGGSMSASTRDIIRQALYNLRQNYPTLRLRMAVYLAAMSPEGAVQR